MTAKQSVLFQDVDNNGNSIINFTSIGGVSDIKSIALSNQKSVKGGNVLITIEGVIQGVSFWGKSDTASSVSPTIVPAGGIMEISASNFDAGTQFGVVINYEFNLS